MCDRWPNAWSSPVGGVDAYMECRNILLIATGFAGTGGGAFSGKSAFVTGLFLNYTDKQKINMFIVMIMYVIHIRTLCQLTAQGRRNWYLAYGIFLIQHTFKKKKINDGL